MATITQLKNNLADAEKQYHLLVTGNKARVVVDENGERVEYTTANATRLQAYIVRLTNQINSTSSGPMQVIF